MYTHHSRGFTLIELLVVIAIIGILSSVVLASLSTARSKGNDAAIQSNLSSIQTQAEIYYGDNAGASAAGSYGSQAWATAYASCTGGMFGNNTIKKALTAADNANGTTGTIGCYATDQSYVVIATLTNSTAYWCIDSTGMAEKVAAAAPASLTACP